MIFQRGDGYVNANGEPVALDGKLLSGPEDAAAETAALIEQRDTLQAQLSAAQGEAVEKIAALTSERDTLKGTLDSTVAERDQALAVAQSNREGLDQMAGVRDALTTERDALQQELSKAQARINELLSAPTLPDALSLPKDARERLIEINGIGEKLADKVLEVLAAPAEQ